MKFSMNNEEIKAITLYSEKVIEEKNGYLKLCRWAFHNWRFWVHSSWQEIVEKYSLNESEENELILILDSLYEKPQ